MSESKSRPKSHALFEAGKRVIPGGVNSPVRAFRGVGGDPVFFARGKGAYVWDVDGNEYVDYVGSWGPLIAGHAHPEILEAIAEVAASGTSFGAPTEREVQFAAELISAVPSMEMVRLCSSGTEATMAALARRARLHQARQDRQDRRRLSRRQRLPARRRRLGRGHARHPRLGRRHRRHRRRHAHRRLERRSGHARALRRQSRPDRRRHRRAGVRQHGLRAAQSRLLAGAAQADARARHRAHLRRSHDRLSRGVRRRAGVLRRRARPDDAGQDRRRRLAGRRLRRQARHHVRHRAARPRLPSRHAVGQPARRRRRHEDAGDHASPRRL